MGIMDEFIRLRILVESREAQQAKRNLDDLDTAARRTSRGGFADVSGATDSRRSGSAGMSLLMLSQAIEDAQYGFRAIVNNIPGIVMALGGSAGLAGAASIAAVGINQLLNNMDKLAAAVQGTSFEDWLSTGGLERKMSDWISSPIFGLLSQIPIIGDWFAKPTIEIQDQQKRDAAERERIEAEHKARAGRVKGVQDETGNSTLGRAVRSAIGQYGGGETLLKTLMDASPFGDDPRFGETAEDARNRERLRKRLISTIDAAMKGMPTAVRQLTQGLRGTNIGGLLLDALLPASEDASRDDVRKRLERLAGGFDRLTRSANPTAPRATANQKAAAAGQFQQRMESLGIDPEMQSKIASSMTGKDAQRRMADIPAIFEMLDEFGTTDREKFEVLPEIFKEMSKPGGNVFRATQRAINRMQRNGMRANLKGMRESPIRQRARAGMEMLGFDPGIGDENTSRVMRDPGQAPDNLMMMGAEGNMFIDPTRMSEAFLPSVEMNARATQDLTKTIRELIDRGVSNSLPMPPRRR